jgi:hypothetical protein
MRLKVMLDLKPEKKQKQENLLGNQEYRNFFHGFMDSL